MNSISLKRLKISTRRKLYSLLFGDYKSIFKGQGIEFDDLRAYTPGDNAKDIEWKASSRSASFFIKKYKETRELKMLFAISANQSFHYGQDSTFTKRHLLGNFVYLISTIAQQNSDKIGLALISDDKKKFRPYRKGQSQIINIMKSIDEFFTQKISATDGLIKLLDYLLLHKAKQNYVFLIVDQLDIDNAIIRKKLSACSIKYHLFICQINDLLEQDLSWLPQNNLISIIDADKNLHPLPEMLSEYKIRFSEMIQKNKYFCNKYRIPYIAINQNSDMLKELFLEFEKLKNIR